jgi:hypothetical protein
VTANGKLFVSDALDNRVLIWNTLPVGNVPAGVVVGQANFTTGTSGTSRTQMNQPIGIAVAGGRLILSDAVNNRVLIWNTIPTVNSAPAEVVLGQSTFTTNVTATLPTGLSAPVGVWSALRQMEVDGTGIVGYGSIEGSGNLWAHARSVFTALAVAFFAHGILAKQARHLGQSLGATSLANFKTYRA